MKYTISILLVLALISTTFSQNQAEAKPYIEVNGSHYIEVVPNIIHIKITLREKFENKNKLTIFQQEEALKKALTEINIPIDSLSVSDVSAGYIKIKRTKKDVLAEKDYILKVGTATDVAKVFVKLDEIDVKDANIAHTDHSNMIQFRKEVKIKAIKNAKEKADYLLEAIGETTGGALIVRENNYNYNLRGNANGYDYKEREEVSISNHAMKYKTIQFKKLRVSANIFVKFAIKQ